MEASARSFPPDRLSAIRSRLASAGRVVSADVAAQLNVSIDTVRRDLAELEAQGDLRRVHGGAVRLVPSPPRFADRLEREDGAAERIAALAVGLVPRGALLAFAGGTAVLQLAHLLPRDLDATLVTTSPDVALALREHRNVEIDLLGGRLHPASQTVTGADTVAQLLELRPDVCVVSACSIDVEAGVTFRERGEALVVRSMVERSGRLILLATADKVGATGRYVVAPAARVDVLVTDAPPATTGAYELLDIEVVTPCAD